MQLNKEGLPQVIFKLMNKSAINNMYKGHLRFYIPYKWINDEKRTELEEETATRGLFVSIVLEIMSPSLRISIRKI